MLCLFYWNLSAAFDTIYHDNLFCILEKYVGSCGNSLKLIKSYFSYRTQRVQIDNVLSDFANIICDVPQGSVLGPLKLCLYLLHQSAIFMYHNISYHGYADATKSKIFYMFNECSSIESCISSIFFWPVWKVMRLIFRYLKTICYGCVTEITYCKRTVSFMVQS